MPHILLADDDESVAMVARLGLRRAGFEVTIVDHGQSALNAARATAFDALVLDWNMPDVDGIDVCRQLMADPSWARVPIVFLTAASHDGAEQEALAAGARGVIFKPFDPMQVGEQVKALIERRTPNVDAST
jgi:DNA-binding response OmpR family regulator